MFASAAVVLLQPTYLPHNQKRTLTASIVQSYVSLPSELLDLILAFKIHRFHETIGSAYPSSQDLAHLVAMCMVWSHVELLSHQRPQDPFRHMLELCCRTDPGEQEGLCPPVQGILAVSGCFVRTYSCVPELLASSFRRLP